LDLDGGGGSRPLLRQTMCPSYVQDIVTPHLYNPNGASFSNEFETGTMAAYEYKTSYTFLNVAFQFLRRMTKANKTSSEIGNMTNQTTTCAVIEDN
jgi:hypothetical protein